MKLMIIHHVGLRASLFESCYQIGNTAFKELRLEELTFFHNYLLQHFMPEFHKLTLNIDNKSMN